MTKFASGKLILVEVLADKTVVRYPIDQLFKVTAKRGANYTLLDNGTESPPKKMVLRRKGESLVVEDDGKQVAEVEEFYKDNAAATFTTDGSLGTPGNPASGTVIDSMTEMQQAAGSEYHVWPNDDNGAGLFSGNSGWGLLGGAALVGAAAAGGGSGGSGGSSSQPTTLVNGVLTDDYIARAEVFADVNGNGRYDAGEPRTQTDDNGHFTLNLTNTNVAIYAVGGIDTATGVPNQFIYRTYANAVTAGDGTDIVVSPISTMISAVADQLAAGGAVTEAMLVEAAAKLSAALGLTLDDPSVLLNLDPVANATGADATAQDIDILAINRQLALALSAAGGLVNGADATESNQGTQLSADALAAILVERADSNSLFDLTNANDLQEMLQATMDLSNSEGVTEDLRASNEGDLQVLSDVMAAFTQQIDTSTAADPMANDALQSLIAAHDLLVPLLQNAGSEAESDRGGDISLADALQNFTAGVGDFYTPEDFVGGAISTQTAQAAIEDFGAQVNVEGYVGDYVPLGIQLPNVGLGDVVDSVSLDLREVIAQGAELWRYDPLLRDYVQMTVPAGSVANFPVDPTQAGYLFIKTSVELVNQGLFAGQVEIPLSAVNGESSYEGTLVLTIIDRPGFVEATIGEVIDDVPTGSTVIAKGGSTNDNQPTLTGSLSPLPDGDSVNDYTVEIYDNGVYVGDAVLVAGVDGATPTWSFEMPVRPDGSHQFTVRVVDGLNNSVLLSASRPYDVTVDTVAPQAPVVDPSNGAIVRGTGEPGSTVSILDEASNPIGTATVDQNGRWSWTPTTRLPNGTVVQAVAVDPAGNTSDPSATTTVVAQLPSQLVIITAVHETADAVTGDLVPNEGVTNDPTLLVQGTISAALATGEVLKVYATNTVDTVLLGTATVGANGAWTLSITDPDLLAAFPFAISVYARVEKTVDSTVFDGANSNSWNFVLDTSVPAQTVTLTTVDDDVAGVTGAVDADDRINDSRPTFSGTISGDPLAVNESLVVYDTRTVNGVPTEIRVGIATVDGDGNWIFTPAYSLPDGAHNFSFRVEDSAGNQGPATDGFTFSIDTVRPRFASSDVTATPIYENTDTSTPPVVYTAEATDNNAGIVYSLSGTHAGLFEIDPVTGVVTMTGPNPDYDTLDEYVFTVIATDASGNAVEQVVTLPVRDYNVSVTAPVASLEEGSTDGEQTLVYTVTRNIAGRAETVGWSVDVESLGAVDAADLLATSGNVTFGVNDLTAFVTVTVKGDKTIEDDETIALTITSSSMDVPVEPTVVTVLNDDAAIGVSVSSPSFDESNTRDTQDVVFTVYRDNTLSATTVDWTLSSGIGDIDANDLVGGADAMSGTVNFAEGASQALVTVTVKGDRSIELDETLTLTLSNPGDNAVLEVDGEVASTTILNDDEGVAIEVVNTDFTEDNGQIVFRVVRSQSTGRASVDWNVVGTGPDALGTDDFAGPLPTGTVSFADGISEMFVTVNVASDGVFEGDETFSVLLSNPSAGFNIVTGSIDGVVRNDDFLYGIESTTASALEGTGTPGTLVFRVTRAGDLTQDTTVGYEISGYADNTALDDDFATPLSGAVSFADGASVAFLTVEIVGDGALEGYEAFKVTLNALDDQTDFSQQVAAATINPDDSGISIVGVDSETFEDAGSPHIFAIQRSGYLGGTSVVNWEIDFEESAANATDFTGATSGTVTFAAGASVAYVTITPHADYTYEGNESYDVVLSSSQSGVILLQPSASGRLINDESGITLGTAGLTGQEGNEGAERSLSFTVDRVGNINTETVVEWTLTHGTTSAADFADGMLTSGFLTFAAGETAKLVTLPLTADSVVEANKSFTIGLTSHTANAQILSAPATGTIQNDDAVFALQSLSPVLEGNGGTKQIVMTVVRTGDTTSADTVDYAVSEGSANAADFIGGVLPSGSLVFGVGQTAQTITLNLTADSVVEANENFTVTLSNPIAGTTIDAAATSRVVTITNDDDSLSIAATSADKPEGGAGTTSYTFTVTRSGYTTKETVVDWSVAANGALTAADFDYAGQLPSGTVTFASGVTSQVVTVTVKGDNLNEADEAFSVVLGTPPAGTEIATGSATGTIRNDDTGLAISATTVNVAEGDSGTSQHIFTVTRSGVITGSTTVNWAVSGDANATDFGGTLPSGTVSFGAGETVKTITINASGDTAIESNEAFTVTLSNASANADIQVATANSSIVADDIGFAISQAVEQATGAEGATGDDRVLSYTVTRSGDLATAAVIDWAATGLNAADFVDGEVLSGTLSFASNETSKTIQLTLKGDNALESNETLTVALTPTQAKTYATTASVQTVIQNDDVSLAIVADQATQAEGAFESTTPFTFTITPTGVIGAASVVEWRLSSAQAATNDFVGSQDAIGDNNGLPSGRVTFAAGQTSAIVVTVNVAGDDSVEANEQFSINLTSTADNLEFSASSANATITNDDTAFAVVGVSASQAEGQSGTTAYVYNIVRAGVTAGTATVAWTVAGDGDNQATGADFSGGAFPSGTVTFADGQATQSITLLVNGDTAVEATEGFKVTITGVPALTEGADVASGSIVNDDMQFSVAANNATLTEGDSGSQPLIFTISRTGDTTIGATVDYAINGGATSSVSFAATETQKFVTVTVAGDNLVEADDTYAITLSGQSTGTLGTATASTTVLDNDVSLDISAPANALEGDNVGQNTAFVYTVTRSGAVADQETVVDWVVDRNNSTTNINDFAANQDILESNFGLPSGKITFAAGATIATITVNVAQDLQVENDETIRVLLQNAPANVELISSHATATVQTEDSGYSIEAVDASKVEGDSGTTEFVFKIVRAGETAPATADWVVDGALSGNTANAADFGGSLPSGTVTFGLNELEKLLTVAVSSDLLAEFDEGFRVIIDAVSSGLIATDTAYGTILNDDQNFAVSAVATMTEGNSSSSLLTFTVTRSGVMSGSATVEYALTGGAGVDSNDYSGSLPVGTLSFAPNEESKVVTLSVLGDTLAEAGEAYTLTLSNPTGGATLATATATTTVTNDDTNFVLEAPADTAEGGSGTTNVVFTVHREGDATGTGSVNWKLQSSAGLTSADFVGNQDVLTNNSGLPSGTVSFAAGATVAYITLGVQGDTTLENDETLNVVLSSPVGGTIEGSRGSATTTLLTDDDSFSIAGATEVWEGHSGTANVVYTITRTGSLDGQRVVDWTIGGDVDSSDLATAMSGAVTFADGASVGYLTVQVAGDTAREGNENLTVTLSTSEQNVVFGTALAQTQVKNDDADVTIERQYGNESVSEGNQLANAVPYVFVITRGGYLDQVSTVQWSVDTSITDSVNAADFYNGLLPSGTVTFNATETQKFVTVSMRQDWALENDEVLNIKLGTTSTGTVLDVANADAQHIIVNDDAEFNFTAGTATAVEGDNGWTGTAYTYTITRTGNLAQENTLNWSVGGTGPNAASATDFSNGSNAFFGNSGYSSEAQWPSGTVTFAASVATQTITVYVRGDTAADNQPYAWWGNQTLGSTESDETFRVSLGSASLGSSVGSASTSDSTIVNNDTRLTLTCADNSQAEKTSTGGTTEYVYTVTRSGVISGETTVNWTVNHNSTNATDFTGPTSGTVTFLANATVATITVSVQGDDYVNDGQDSNYNEDFYLSLSGGAGYDEINGIGSGGSGLNTTGSIYSVIERDEAIFNMVGHQTYNGYTGEYFLNAAAEGDTVSDEGSGNVARVITIERSVAFAGEATVNWKVNPYNVPSNFSNWNNAVAMDVDDFVSGKDALGSNNGLPSGTVTFADGQTLGYITVMINADNAGEFDEAFQVQLLSTSPGSSLGAQTTGYMVAINEDTGFTISVDGDVTEGQDLVYTINREDDTRGSDTITWTLVLPGSEVTNEGNASGALPVSAWYDLDWSDLGTIEASDGSTYTYDPDTRTLSGTVTFVDGVSSHTITIATINDALTESWREFVPSMTLSNPTNITGEGNDDLETPFIEEGSSGSAWVYDNEPEPLLTVTADQTSLWEGTNTGNYGGAGNQVVFTVHRGDVDGRDGALADYPTLAVWRLEGNALTQWWGDAEVLTITGANVSGVSTPQYTPWPTGNSTTTWGLVSFAPGQTTAEVTVTFQGDVEAESDKNLTFSILSAADAQSAADHGYVGQPDYGPANASPTDASVGVELKTDDVQLSASFDYMEQIGYTLGNYEGRDISFTVNRAGRSDVDVVVDYTITLNGSAGASDVDGTLTGTVTIAAGQSSTRVTLDAVDLLNDTTSEGTESFTLTLTAPADVTDPADPVYVRFDGGTSSTKAMTGYVYDDDNTYTVTAVNAAAINENDDPNWTPFVFAIQRNSQGSPETTQAYWRIVGTSAGLDASDFISGLQTGSVTLNQGGTDYVTIYVQSDRLVEINETFKLEVYQDRTYYTNITNTFETPFSSPTRTITNDDTGISIADTTIAETDSNQEMVFTVTRTGDLSGASTMNWALAHVGTAGADIIGTTNGSLSFGANVSIQTITVTVAGDITPEAAETFTITLSDLIGIDHSIDTQAVGTIQNDDSAFSISAGAAAAEGAGQVFTITRTHVTVQDQTIDWAVTGTGTLTAGDFASGLPSGSVTFSGTELIKTITVTSNNDTTTETNEDYTVTITTGAGTTGDLITTATATGTIIENDTTFTATANNLSRLEGHTGSGEYVLTITRSGSLAGAATVDWAVAAGVADAADFGGTLPSGTVTFAAGETAQQVTVSIAGDQVVEADETFSITLSNAVAAAADGVNVDNSTVFTITNDDSTIAIGANDAVKAEGNTGTTDFIFEVVRTGYLGAAATVNYAVSGADVNAADFNGMSGELNLAAGDATTYLTIKVNGDQLAELDENFTVTLSNPSAGVSITDATADGTIESDDTSFSVAGPVPTAEGANAALTDFVFTVTRNGALGAQTLNWNVAGVGADGADSADFNATSGTVTFGASDTVQYVTVKVKGDYTLEPDENFDFTLSGGTGVTFENDGKASATILNDEVAFSLLPPTVLSVDEGTGAGTTQLVYTVIRSGVTSGVDFVQVAYSGTATVDADYTKGLTSGGIAFFPGDTTAYVTITMLRDADVETNETITVTLQNPSAGTFLNDAAKTFTATLVNDDSAVVISALSADKAEGQSGTTPYTFEIVRTGDLGEQATVDYAISGISANDIVGSLNSSVVLAANQATTVLTVLVQGDRLAEGDEPFTVTLSNAPAGVTLTTASASGNIRTDDVVFDVTAPANALEGADGDTTTFNFVVTRAGNLSGEQVLSWSVAGTGGSDAADAADFVATSGYVTFAAGATVATVGVQVKGDYTSEPDEAFRLTLAADPLASDFSEITFTNSAANATILNDEASFNIAATTTNLNEGHSGSVDHVFTVTRSGNLNLVSTVDWAVTAGDTQADDYLGGAVPTGATLTFGVGQTAQTITVKTAGDTATETDENFQVALSNGSVGSNIITGTATGKIVSDDISWSVASSVVPAAEGDAGSAHVFMVTRTGSTAATSVDWSVAGSGTHAATADDFSGNLLPSGTVVFAAGVMTQYVTVNVAGDSILENDEGFTLSLAAPASGNQTHNFTVQTADSSIVNDDDVMSIAALDASKLEGSSGNTPFTFTVTRTGSLSGVSTVGWTIDHDTTVAGDFAATSGVVTFADGVSSMVLTVNVVGDRAVELAEGFNVVLQNPGSGSTIDAANDTATGSIGNDDVDLALAGVTTTVVEGDNGTAGTLVYSVTRTGDLTATTTVDWAVVAGSATAADFAGGVLPEGTLTFAAGQSVMQVTVALAGDGLDEGDESFTLQLSNASAEADITSNDVSGTITDDDDTLSVFSFLPATAEGAADGVSNYVFAVTRSADNLNATGTATVGWSVAGSGAHALSTDEFVATSGSVTFEQGQTTKFVTVQVKGDAVGEYDETFTITLGSPSFGSTIATATADATVVNDDAALLISADQPSGQLEGVADAETEFTFTVVRTGNTTDISTVDWNVQPSGEYLANAMDFGGAYPSGTVVFAAGEATKQITVKVAGDAVGEFDESFKVVLADAVNATILESEAETTILNDDTGVSIALVGAAEQAEGNTGTTNFIYRVERVGDLAATTVAWNVYGTGDYQAGTDDFVGGVLPAGTLSFANGVSELFITVGVTGDDTYGPDESFRVVLSGNANLINREVVSVIGNDDSLVGISSMTPSLVEDDAGNREFVFAVTRTGALGQTALVDWVVEGTGGHPADAADFGGSLPFGSVSFAANQSVAMVTLLVSGDTLAETDETFHVALSSATGSGVSIDPTRAEASATIVSDDSVFFVTAGADGNVDSALALDGGAGSGFDTAYLDASDAIFDLNAITSFENIESIDISGYGANTLALDVTALPAGVVLSDVFNQDAADGFSVETQLLIKGDADDQVDLKGTEGWSDGGSILINGAQYDVWNNASVQLLIDTEIQVVGHSVP